MHDDYQEIRNQDIGIVVRKDELKGFVETSDDGYSFEVIGTTKKLITNYYSWKLSPKMSCFVELALKQMEDIPDIGLFKLLYSKGWTTKQIARKMRCSEKVVSTKVDMLVKRASISLFGIDALYLD